MEEELEEDEAGQLREDLEFHKGLLASEKHCNKELKQQNKELKQQNKELTKMVQELTTNQEQMHHPPAAQSQETEVLQQAYARLEKHGFKGTAAELVRLALCAVAFFVEISAKGRVQPYLTIDENDRFHRPDGKWASHAEVAAVYWAKAKKAAAKKP